MTGCLKFVEYQMANTFFGFNTTLNEHGDRLGSSPDDLEGLEAEEEYDALNDETFGALENADDLEDWEAQHEQFAEIAESSRHSNDIESIFENLGLSDDDNAVIKKENNTGWTYNELKNGDKLNTSYSESNKLLSGLSNNNDAKAPGAGAQRAAVNAVPKLQTVEELERVLLNQLKTSSTTQQGAPRFPPGFQPLVVNSSSPWPSGTPSAPCVPPPGLVRIVGRGPPPGFMPYPRAPPAQGGFPIPHHFNFPPPPRLTSLPPGLLPARPGAPPHHPGGPHPHAKHPPYPHHPLNLPPHPNHQPPYQQMTTAAHHHHRGNSTAGLLPQMHQHPGYHHHQNAYFPGNNNNYQQQQQSQPQQQQQQQQPIERDRGGGSGGGDTRDEYAGLMNNREKQWLLNIQLLQVNTGTPYFDDYYYTVFKERQAKNKDISFSEQRSSAGNQRYQNRGGNMRDNSKNHVQEAQNPVKKTYTPLQFENSLGKLQFGSVTAPRKIIDMDIIATGESDAQASSRDSRKTKQLLLELEALYSIVLKAEDLRNPVALANQEKLVELRQKQRLREMDAAPTPEQKQQVLKLLQSESETPRETPQDLLARILSSLLDAPPPLTSIGSTTTDHRLTSFLGVRKGKMLLLRALPQFDLYADIFHQQIKQLWTKVLTALAVVGRRDSSGDNIIIKYYPMFKKFINSATDFDEIIELVSSLIETIRIENSRSTPLSHQSKAPIHFILQNKFGISAIAIILHRVDSKLLPGASDRQFVDWSTFLTSLVDAAVSVVSVTSPPLEPISDECLNRHCKLVNLTQDKKLILEKIFVENI